MVFAASSMPEKVHWVATMELSMGLIKTGVVTAMGERKGYYVSSMAYPTVFVVFQCVCW